jgi:hypothetical protein
LKKEKFDELIYKSGLIAQGCWEKFDEYDQAALARLVELIVRECISVPYAMWDNAELNADIAVKIENRINQHFGVE